MNITLIILVLIGVLLFDITIIAHEWGHFITAKAFGVKVNEFALGMGPKIFSIKRGETDFSIRALPFGGFCAMEGEEEGSDDPRSFDQKKAWQKIIILISGATMDFFVGFLLTVIILMQSPKFASNTVSKFTENATSQSCGLRVGDEFVQIDSTHVFSSRDLATIIAISNKDSFDLKVKRDGKIIDLKGVKFETVQNADGKISAKADFFLKPIEKNFFTLIRQSSLDMISTIQTSFISFKYLITGKMNLKSVSGPVGIVSIMGQATSEGLKTSLIAGLNNLIYTIAIINISLGVFNLLPLPALDGGRAIFCLFELITGKKLNPKYESWIHAIGFILIILLAIVITYNDIIKLLGWG